MPARVALQGRIRRSSPAHNAHVLGMETPLRGRSGGHAGAAPTVSFGWIAYGWLVSFGWIVCGRLMSFGWIVRKWLFCLYGIVWKNMMEMGRGGACVPARVAQQGRIHRSSPAHNACILAWKRCCADVRAGTQAPPLRFRLDVARGCCPYHFKYNFLCFTVLTEDKKISKHTCISLRDCYIIAHRNNWYD